MKTFHDSTLGSEPSFRPTHPLLRIVVAAALATSITWLGGLLFGPLSGARAQQLAQGMSATPQRGAEATPAYAARSGPTPRATPSGPAA